ncbi:MAG TPA: alkaline phosphatase family protein, partial [Thermoanaerobaculia bacterium]|nr:alkaline phosphatase family protein [Thermoanaerobaculia bacterium]
AAKASALLRDVWRVVDRAASRYMRFRAKGDVFFVSDHGMRPIRRSLYIEELLRRLGFLKAENQASGKRRVAADSPVDASTGGGVAFVLVNRAGVLPGGVVPPEKVDALVAEIADALRRATDDDGKPIFSQVATRLEATELGLDHPNAGDLVLVAADGTTMRGGFPAEGEKASLFGEGENPGQHGFGPDPKLDGIFFHVGEGVEAQRVESFRAVDVAARVSERLQIDPPRIDR